VIALFVSTFIKFFFLLTPFFVLSTFLAMTTNYTPRRRTALAIQVTVAVLITSAVILAIGNFVFAVFGITLDAFRVGTGVLLMLTAVKLVNGTEPDAAEGAENLAVVPLAIPVTVGPATTGALLVMGGETHSPAELLVVISALVVAIVLVGVILLSSAAVERLVKKRGLTILSKITGLILAALAAQLIMTGAQAFLA
jgi:multiple antibiotic resistance protein